MTLLKATLAATTFALAACGTQPDRYAVTAPAVTQNIAISFRSLEVKDVSLPAYAAADEIAVQDADGKLVTKKDQHWADNPERAVALELARNLAKLSGARVASEPWPFEAFPDARLEVRFEDLIAQSDGTYRASGQYFVGTENTRREGSGLFELAVAYDISGGPQAIARARGEIVRDLAAYIAENSLR